MKLSPLPPPRSQATVFVYLADCERGGETRFPRLNGGAGLSVRPRRGTAVVHFPTLRDPASGAYLRDERCVHEAAPAVDVKWILATWLWRDAHAGRTYLESDFAPLSDDII